MPFARRRLLEQGLMDKSAPRGMWSITSKGRERISVGAITDETQTKET